MTFEIFALVLAAIYLPGSTMIEMHRRGEINRKRVGGLTFVRFGRLSFSYCVRSY